MGKMTSLLSWELSSLLRLRLLLPLVAFMFFTSYLGGEVIAVTVFSGLEVLFKFLARHVGLASFIALEGVYMAMAFFSSILVASSFAGEMDTGILKFYLSLPLGRLKVFVAKVMASYIMLFSVGLGAIYYKAFMIAPEAFPRLLAASPFYILQPGLLLALQLLFTFSISLYFSVVSKKLGHAALYSLLTLYSFYTIRLVDPEMRWYFPPYTFAMAWGELAKNVVYFTSFSIILTFLSAYMFVRRLEVS